MRLSQVPATGLLFLCCAFVGISVVSGACTGNANSESSSSSSSGSTASSQATSQGGSSSQGGASSHVTSSSHATASSGMNTSGFLNADGGLAFDANYEPHMGTPETGVGCGTGVVCTDPTANCCIGFTGGSCGATCSLAVTLACDGPEDCPTAGDVCCFGGASGATCGPAADCMGGSGLGAKSRLCNVSADCPTGAGCCRSSYLSTYDVGQCIEGCNVNP